MAPPLLPPLPLQRLRVGRRETSDGLRSTRWRRRLRQPRPQWRLPPAPSRFERFASSRRLYWRSPLPSFASVIAPTGGGGARAAAGATAEAGYALPPLELRGPQLAAAPVAIAVFTRCPDARVPVLAVELLAGVDAGVRGAAATHPSLRKRDRCWL